MAPEEKRTRLLEAAAALLEAAPSHRLNTVSLNKGLFYMDLVCLRDHGETFTRNSYIALPFGPVVAKYAVRLIKPLKEEGIAEQEVEGLTNPVSLLKSPRFELITKDVRSVAHSVSRWCCKKTSADVSRFSHKNPGWRIARDDERHGTGQKQAIDMYIAVQQIVENDPWIGEALSDAGLAACSSADNQEGDPW